LSRLFISHVSELIQSVTLEEIHAQGYVLTPGRYVGAAAEEADDEPFEQKIIRLTEELEAQFEDSNKLQERIKSKIKTIIIE
jgi:type I restriction enzyme M protein